MGGMIVIPKKKHNRIIEEKDKEIENLKNRLAFLENQVLSKNKKIIGIITAQDVVKFRFKWELRRKQKKNIHIN